MLQRMIRVLIQTASYQSEGDIIVYDMAILECNRSMYILSLAMCPTGVIVKVHV